MTTKATKSPAGKAGAKKLVNIAHEGATVKRIRPGFILPSAALTIDRKKIRFLDDVDKQPEAGDLVYGTVDYVGQHATLENQQGRIHQIGAGSKAVFVFGNRYAPDYYEGVVPEEFPRKADLLARSGIIGVARAKNANIKDPTQIRLRGYVCDREGKVINTGDVPKLRRPQVTTKKKNRAKMILVVGTSMNSGKSFAAAACCWALSTMGHTVRASKVTGTASLKDILLMEDSGARPVTDFSYMGYPSTYLLAEDRLLDIFNTLDLKYANNPRNYWVVEMADGVLQRETAMLLQSECVRSRIHKLIFAAHDAFGAMGGVDTLKKRFGLEPDAISGVVSGSPLGIQELQEFTDIPVFNNMQRDLKQMASILI